MLYSHYILIDKVINFNKLIKNKTYFNKNYFILIKILMLIKLMLIKRVTNELLNNDVINLNLKKNMFQFLDLIWVQHLIFVKKYLFLLFTSSQVKIGANIHYIYHKYLVKKF